MASAAPHLDITVVDNDIEAGAAAVLAAVRPAWPRTSVAFKAFTDGITNKLIGCFNRDNPDDVILVRVYGHNTDLLIDRRAETQNIKLLQTVGFAPPIFATFNNGLCYQYIPGEVLTVDSVRAPAVYPLIARRLAQLHSVPLSGEGRPTLWDKLQQFISLVPNTYSPPDRHQRYVSLVAGGVAGLRAELASLAAQLQDLGSPVVFCHNDLLLANVILQPSSAAVSFIDYEYAAPNYQAFDIGNHFDEFAGVTDVDYSRYPEESLQRDWLTVYLTEFLGHEPSQRELDVLYVQVNKFALAANFMWGIWALVQAHHSNIDFDFLQYASLRLTEYHAKKDSFFAMELPR